MFYGLDGHQRFIQICALDDRGAIRLEFQVRTTPEAIDQFAGQLGMSDQVVVEATFHT